MKGKRLTACVIGEATPRAKLIIRLGRNLGQPLLLQMGRVVSKEELIAAAGKNARGPRRVVFTNGCFDLLHPGHIRLLELARSLGDVLVVGINSDDSVRRLKGKERPLINESERAELLAALEAVDLVTIFDESTPRELIVSLLPDVLIKGADWGPQEIVGRKEVESAGGEVRSIPLEAGYSTSKILEKIRAGALRVPAESSIRSDPGDTSS